MAVFYEPLSRLSSESYSSTNTSRRYADRNTKSWLMPVLVVVLLTTNLLLLGWHQFGPMEQRVPADYARTQETSTVYRRFWWNTAYGSSNRTESDTLWDAILPSHGIVAVDRDWAAEKGWPASTYLPDDKSKGAYLLEAYHHLHCLRIIRKTLWEAIDGRPFTYHPGHHMDHCFDALRQSVQCNADATPLYTFGDFTAGDGQLHKCRDWDELRDWATQNTACYRDSVEGIPFGDHFGHCDNGDDGVRAIDYGAVIG